MGGFGSFTDPLITGLGKLIREFIQSVNYVAGISGWILNKDGSCEFSDATIRGSIEAGNGTVRLNSGGVKVTGPTRQFDINIAGGFLARLVPDDGSYVQMIYTASGTSMGLFMHPADPSPINATTYSFGGRMVGSTKTTGTKDQGQLNIFAPIPTGKATCSINLLSQGSDSATDDSVVQLYGSSVTINDADIGAGWVAGDGLTAPPATVNATETVQLTARTAAGASYTYKAGRLYRVVVSAGVLTGAVATQPQFRIRKTNTAGQQLDAFLAPCPVVTTTFGAHYEAYFQVGATNVTADIVVSLQGAVAPGGVQIRAFATSPAQVNIYDDRNATAGPWTATLV